MLFSSSNIAMTIWLHSLAIPLSLAYFSSRIPVLALSNKYVVFKRPRFSSSPWVLFPFSISICANFQKETGNLEVANPYSSLDGSRSSYFCCRCVGIRSLFQQKLNRVEVSQTSNSLEWCCFSQQSLGGVFTLTPPYERHRKTSNITFFNNIC